MTASVTSCARLHVAARLVRDGPSIPPLRRVRDRLRLSPVAGLINENMREVITKFPGLGSIPLLGALFRSQEFRKGETELLILVTPHLAKPLVPAEVQLPTDNFVEPSDFGWFLQGKLEGRH